MTLYKRCLTKKGWEETEPTKDEVSSIELIEKVVPVYPVEAISLCALGRVKVRFIVKKDGSVKDISIISAKPEGVFDVSVVNAISEWRFKPIVANGKLIEQYVLQELVFKAHEQCSQDIENSVD